MKTINLAALIFVFLTSNHLPVISQNQLQVMIGGPVLDEAISITQTSDSGYVAAGYTESFTAGLWDFYLVKLNSSGSLQWTRSIGGSGFELCNSIIQTTDGGYVAAGYTNSFGAGNYDMFIVKLNSSGVLQWSRTIGGTGGDGVRSLIQTSDGGYIAAGYTFSFGSGGGDFYIVKLDASGMLQWNKTVGGPSNDFAHSIIQTADGGYAVAGGTSSFGAGGGDFYIVKLDASGMLQWSRTAGGAAGDVSSSIIQTTDGGYALGGTTNSFGAGFNDFYVVKLDTSGMLQWGKTVGGVFEDYCSSITQTADGGYTMAGTTEASTSDFYIVKLNSGGTLQWSRAVGGWNNEYNFSMIQTTDGGFAVSGGTGSFGASSYDFYIVKLDASGNSCGNFYNPGGTLGTGGTSTSPTSIVTTPTSIVMTHTPSTNTGGTVSQVCLVGIEPGSNEIPEEFSLSQNYPNPFNPATTIKFQISKSSFAKLVIYDALGHEIATLINEQMIPGTYDADWDASNFPSGVYFYKLTAGVFTDVKKMVLIK